MLRRREFLTLPAAAAAQSGGPKRIAALSTTYHVRSHTDNFVTRFLEGYWIGERFYPPPADIVSLYMDQVHPADIGRRLAAAYGFPVVRSIADALTLGTGRLAVDGVLLVAEHGNYPFNDRSSNSIRASSSSSRWWTCSANRARPSRCSAISIFPTTGPRRGRCTNGRASWAFRSWRARRSR